MKKGRVEGSLGRKEKRDRLWVFYSIGKVWRGLVRRRRRDLKRSEMSRCVSGDRKPVTPLPGLGGRKPYLPVVKAVRYGARPAKGSTNTGDEPRLKSPFDSGVGRKSPKGVIRLGEEGNQWRS